MTLVKTMTTRVSTSMSNSFFSLGSDSRNAQVVRAARRRCSECGRAHQTCSLLCCSVFCAVLSPCLNHSEVWVLFQVGKLLRGWRAHRSEGMVCTPSLAQTGACPTAHEITGAVQDVVIFKDQLSFGVPPCLATPAEMETPAPTEMDSGNWMATLGAKRSKKNRSYIHPKKN